MPRRFTSFIGSPRRRAWFTALAVLAASSEAGAAARRPERRTEPTPPAATLSLHEAVARAWARLPQRDNLAARQNRATARYVVGSALTPNAPSANGSYVNDKIAGSNYNYLTSQVELSTPVWLPGEGTATQRLAQADSAAVYADADATHLQLAAEVLDLATKAALALNNRDVAARRLATDRSLANDLAHRLAVGESSQSDALAAQAEASSAEVALGEAEGQLSSARIALASVLGVEQIPALDVPAGARTLRPIDDMLAAHPRMVAADRAIEAARANLRLVHIQDRDDPEIGLQGTNEKQPGTRWDTRFGVTLHFHFATEARNAPLRAAAQETLTQAEVSAAVARREILAGLQQAETMLAAYQRSAAAAERAAADLEKRRGQIERAWRLGEMPFIELVRANALALDAVLARDKARTSRSAALLQLQLAQGQLP